MAGRAVTYATIDALRESLAQPAQQHPPEYVAKMLHAVPQSTVVDRVAFVLERVTGKRVLEFGASGPLHLQVMQAAALYAGVDRVASDHVVAFDLDDVTDPELPLADDPEIVLCGEVLEHLANPGYFLRRLRRQYLGVPVLITVPNAFSRPGSGHMARGVENVNIDHVAWYSYRTLGTLIARFHYQIEAFHWYGGDPYTAEGLIMVVR